MGERDTGEMGGTWERDIGETRVRWEGHGRETLGRHGRETLGRHAGDGGTGISEEGDAAFSLTTLRLGLEPCPTPGVGGPSLGGSAHPGRLTTTDRNPARQPVRYSSVVNTSG